MSKHTLGPWKVVKAIDTWMVASCGDGLMIQSAPCHGDSVGAAEDDARLIAAAPELLEALKGIFRLIDAGLIGRDTSKDADPAWIMKAMDIVVGLKLAKDAIAKAEGSTDV